MAIDRLSHATVYVLDQDSALAFYTEKLGFELREDARLGTFRWLTVGPKTQPELTLVLMPIAEGPMMNADQAASLRALVQSGALGGGVFATTNCRESYETLKPRGVEFARAPKEMPYGVEAVFRDDSGNIFSLPQRR